MPLATYQSTFPDAWGFRKLFTTIIYYHYPPAYYVTMAAGYSGQNAPIEEGQAETKGGQLETFPGI